MWSTEKTLQLIEEFHNATCLWDVTSADYKNRSLKKVTIDIIARKFNISITEVEKKLHNLKTQFHREYRKVKQAKKNGCSPFKARWFAYKNLLFLLRRTKSRGSRNTDCEDPNENKEIGLNPHEGSSLPDNSTIEERPEDKKPSTPSKTSSDPKRPRKKEDTSVQQALKCMESLSEVVSSRDEHAVFGEHVANKMRSCHKRPHIEISMAQHHIHDILLRLELGMYANQCSTSIPPPVFFNPLRHTKAPSPSVSHISTSNDSDSVMFPPNNSRTSVESCDES